MGDQDVPKAKPSTESSLKINFRFSSEFCQQFTVFIFSHDARSPLSNRKMWMQY